MEALAQVLAAGQIAAALAVYGGMFTGIGQGNIAGKAIEAMARQPEARGSVSSTMIISLAMAETNGIYGLVVALILLFANPMVAIFERLLPTLG
jgi:F-type H+-transporting ATPase subunit c